jgi:hypothetical protein
MDMMAVRLADKTFTIERSAVCGSDYCGLASGEAMWLESSTRTSPWIRQHGPGVTWQRVT